MSLDVSIEQFHQPDNDGDNWSNAYKRALSYWIDYTNEAKFVDDARGFTLRFMAKEYKFNDSIDVVRGMHLVGSGGSSAWGGTRLLFPHGVDGIIIHHVIPLQTTEPNPNDIQLQGHDREIFDRGLTLTNLTVPDGITALRGSGTVIERMTLHAMPALEGAIPKEAHGITMRTAGVLRDLYINNFSGNGIDIRAWVPTWNANGWQVQNCFIGNCQDGFYCWGSDVNAGCATAISCTGNRGWGIWDASFLGNTYIACHSDGNAEGSYRTGTAKDGSRREVASNLFLGCYSEGTGYPGGRVVMKAPTVVIGGLISPIQHWRNMGISDTQIETDPIAQATFEEFRSTATFLTTGNGSGLFPNGGITGESVNPSRDFPQFGRSRAYARLGSGTIPNTAFAFGWLKSETDDRPSDSAVYSLIYQHKSRPEEKGWWAFSSGEGDEIGSPLRLSTTDSPEKRGQIWFQNGYYVGGGNNLFEASDIRPRLRVLTGIAAPKPTDPAQVPPVEPVQWQLGDRILNAYPDPTDTNPNLLENKSYAGWIYTTVGWKPYGKIEL